MSSLAAFSDKEVDVAFLQKLYKNRENSFNRGMFPNVTSSAVMSILQEDKRKFQQFLNFEKKMLSWVNYLDAGEKNDIFSSKMVKWRDKNESCSRLILIKEIEKEMKKYDEKTQVIFFILFAYRGQSIFRDDAFVALSPYEVEGTRSFDSGSYETNRVSMNMNAIVRNLHWLSQFVSRSSNSEIEDMVEAASIACDRLPEVSEIFPNWDMEEIYRLMTIKDKEDLKDSLALFASSSWTPNTNFQYTRRSAFALYPYLDIRFDDEKRTPEFMKAYFDTIVDIYESSKVVDANLCGKLNTPLSLASMLGFDVDPLNKEYSLFTQEDFKKWMEIKASVNVAEIRGIGACGGTLRFIDNVWGGSSLLPNPSNSLVRMNDDNYMGKVDVNLYYYPQWQARICMKGSLKDIDGHKYVIKSSATGAFGCW